MKQILLLVAACMYSFILIAQPLCGFDQINQQQKLRDINYIDRLKKTEQRIKNYISNHSGNRNTSGTNINTENRIPLVVHVLHTGGTTGTAYPTDQQIIDAVFDLNRAFRGTLTGMEPPSPTGAAGDIEIRFSFAARTPLNSFTNGIERIDASCLPNYSANGVTIDNSVTGCPDLIMKSLSRWDPSSYLNIWVVNKINGSDGVSSPATPGYSSFPDWSSDLDGIVILASTLISFEQRKFTLPHEVAHYFNIYHTFEDYDPANINCQPDYSCSDTGDHICDTDPISEQVGLVCRTGPNPCSSINHHDYSINTEYNYMSYSSCRTLFTNGQKERMNAALVTHPHRVTLISSSNLALTQPTPNQYFNTCTSPTFKTNDFTCIGVGKDGNIWAGTYQRGLYKYSSVSGWERAAVVDSNAINDIKSDRDGGIWVAQSGRGSLDVAFDGGIEYFPDSFFASRLHYGGTIARPARYILNLFVDTTRLTSGNLPVVWSANWYNSTGGNYTSGGLGKGLNTMAVPGFDLIREGIQTIYNFGNLRCVGGNATEIWAYSKNNYNKSQILVYDAQTGSLNTTYDYLNTGPYLTSNFTAKAILFDKNGNKWIGMQEGGLVVVDKDNIWRTVNFSGIFPVPTNPSTPPINASTYVNSNAITGDTLGNVFIGTNNGLIIYSGGPLDKECSYKRYTTNDGLTSNNVKGICVDLTRRKILLATDNGINFWSPINTTGSSTQPYVTTASGDMNNPSIWCGGTVPPFNSDVTVKHVVTITAHITLNSLKAEQGGTVIVATGANLTISNQH